MESSSGYIKNGLLINHLFFNEFNTITFLLTLLLSLFGFTSIVMYLGICPSSITLYLCLMTVLLFY